MLSSQAATGQAPLNEIPVLRELFLMTRVFYLLLVSKKRDSRPTYFSRKKFQFVLRGPSVLQEENASSDKPIVVMRDARPFLLVCCCLALLFLV
jgi:hypothetical protein